MVTRTTFVFALFSLSACSCWIYFDPMLLWHADGLEPSFPAMPNGFRSIPMSPVERLDEVARLLALGILRCAPAAARKSLMIRTS